MAIALVAHTSRAANGTTAGIDTTGATLLVAAVAWTQGSAAYTNTPTDSKSNLWMSVAIMQGEIAQTTADVNLWVSVNPTVGAAHTFTCGAGSPAMAVAAFSGVATTYPIGQSRLKGATSVTSVQPGSLTPPLDNNLVITAIGYRDTTALSINGSFTISDQVAFSSGVNVGIGLAYLIQTSAAAANPTWSWTNASNTTCSIAYFQPTVSAGGGGEHSAVFLGS